MPETFLKETPAQAFSCKFCETFKDKFLIEHNRTIVSVRCLLFLSTFIRKYII